MWARITGEDIVITDRRALVQNYFSKSFFMMIVPSVVYWIVTFLSSEALEARGHGADLWLWWIVSLLRGSFKIKRLYTYNKAIEMNLEVSVSSLQLVKFWLMILLSGESAASLSCPHIFVHLY